MADTKKATELGEKPIGTLLWQYALPAIIAMTASSLYNMVDSVFIGRGVGALAISGLALTFPLMNLTGAFGAMIGVGASTLMSVRLGQKDYSTARLILGNVVLLNIIMGVGLTFITIPFLDEILTFFGGSDQTVPYAREYMQIILAGNAITHLYLGLNAQLRASGHPREAMNATIATVVLNTALDPLFIYTFDMGIRGAAIATVIAQVVSLCYQIHLFSRKDELVSFRKEIFHLRARIVGDSLLMGLSSFLMNIAACFVVILVNQGLAKYGTLEYGEHGGDLAIGAYGIANRIAFFIVMIVLGLTQGMQPISGYNYGAQKNKRVVKVLWLTSISATVVTTTGTAVCMLFAEEIAQLFTMDATLIAMSATAMRIMLFVFPFVGFQIVAGNFFQSIGKAGMAIFLSLSRQVLVLIPCILFLPMIFGYHGVWYSMPVSDGTTTIVASLSILIFLRKFKKQ